MTDQNANEEFRRELASRVAANGRDPELREAAQQFLAASVTPQYSYNFTWLGRPVIQYPQDIVAMQELIWQVQPDLIIETGIAHGGSLILYASMLELLHSCNGHDGSVLGIDIDIRAHNRAAIEEHPMYKRIEMIEGSSIATDIVEQVHQAAMGKSTVMVVLDSNHTHKHVLAELHAYASLTSVGSYCVVFDTLIEDMPEGSYPDRDWGIGNNPKTAVAEFLATHPEFSLNKSVEDKILISVASGGYLQRVAE